MAIVTTPLGSYTYDDTFRSGATGVLYIPLVKTTTVVAPPPPSPVVGSTVTGIDPVEFSNALYGKPIPISALGKARIGQAAGPVCGPYFSDGAASFGVSFGFPANVTGTRVLFEISFNSKVSWESTAGTATISSGTFFTDPFTARFYQGTLTQSVDPLETTHFGAEAIAYRPQMLIFFENLPLAQFGGQIPFVSAMIGDTTSGAVPVDGINLGVALERIAYSPWLEYDATTFDTIDLTDIVQGLILSDSQSFMDLLRNTTRVYRSLDILQTDKLYLIDRGATVTPDITLTRDRIVADGGIEFSRQEQNSVPRELELITIDPDADYVLLPSKAQTPRYPVPVTASVGKETINFPVIIDASTRQSLVTYAKYAEESARKRLRLTAMAYGYELEPGDLLRLQDIGDGFETETYKVIESDHGANLTVQLTCEAILKCALPTVGVAELVRCFTITGLPTPSSYTFTAADLGVADANRRNIVAVNVRPATTGATIAVTINGVPATEAAFVSNAAAGLLSGVYYAATPTGATGDIVVTQTGGGGFTKVSAMVYRAVSTVFALADFDTDQAVTASPVDVALDVPAGGILIAAGATRLGASIDWTGATVDCTHDVGTSESASYQPATAETAYVVSIDPSSIDQVTLAAASFTL